MPDDRYIGNVFATDPGQVGGLLTLLAVRVIFNCDAGGNPIPVKAANDG